VFALGAMPSGVRVDVLAPIDFIPSRKMYCGFTEEQLKRIVRESYMRTLASSNDYIFLANRA